MTSLPQWVRTNRFYKAVLGKNSQTFTVNKRQEVPEHMANLVSSEIGTYDGVKYHYPLLDIDFEAALIPSSTPGHYHLYLKKALTHEQYTELLRTLKNVGIIQNGIWRQMTEVGDTCLRLPHIKKENASEQD